MQEHRNVTALSNTLVLRIDDTVELSEHDRTSVL